MSMWHKAQDKINFFPIYAICTGLIGTSREKSPKPEKKQSLIVGTTIDHLTIKLTTTDPLINRNKTIGQGPVGRGRRE